MKERFFRMNGKRVNGDVAAVGVALKITIVLAKWHAANTKRSQHQLGVPFGYRHFWQLLTLCLRVGKDAADWYAPKIHWFGIRVVPIPLGEDWHVDFICLASGDHHPTKCIPELHLSDWFAYALLPEMHLVMYGIEVEAAVHLADIAGHIQGCFDDLAPVDLTLYR